MIGIFVNATIQGFKGKSTLGILGAAGIGAVGGAAAGAAGSVINAAGFISGAINGAIGGFAGGFVTGAGNAWADGANFKNGLGAGLRSGGIGAGGGAILGGVMGGVSATLTGGDFWTGKGSTSVSPMESVNEDVDLGGEYFKDNKSMHQHINEKNGWEPGKYGIDQIDVETNIDLFNGDDKYSLIRTKSGILMSKASNSPNYNTIRGVVEGVI